MTGRTGACPVCGAAREPDCAVLAAHLDWLAMRGRAPATTLYHRERAVLRVSAVLPVPLLHAAAADLAAWRAGLERGRSRGGSAGLAAATIADYVSHVRGFCAWAAAEGLAAADAAASLPVPALRRRLPRPISEADLMYAVDAAPRRIRPWLVLAAWCGLRAKEIACLRRENVLETAAPPVLLVASDATKGSTERIVPLSAFALAELAWAGLPRSGWVFPRCDGLAGPNTPGLVSRLASGHLHDCGIPATLHQLRHRFGTMTYHASHDLLAVQQLLGHASPVTTAVYAAYDRPGATAAVEALPVPGSAA